MGTTASTSMDLGIGTNAFTSEGTCMDIGACTGTSTYASSWQVQVVVGVKTNHKGKPWRNYQISKH